MRLATLLLAVSPLFLGCSGAEVARQSCHARANLAAEEAWFKACGAAEWNDCPEAEAITAGLESALEECDE